MPYSYTGNFPNQQLKNTGIFTTSDIVNLQSYGEWGGSLELIEEQSATSGSSIDFTNIKGYEVHMIQYTDLRSTATTELKVRISNDGGSTFISDGYKDAYCLATGTTFTDVRSTNRDSFRLGNRVANNRSAGGYVYLYNLLNSSIIFAAY